VLKDVKQKQEPKEDDGLAKKRMEMQRLLEE
jgi:hypothetical protein